MTERNMRFKYSNLIKMFDKIVVVDTNIIINIQNGKNGFYEKIISKHENHKHVLVCMTMFSFAEIFLGMKNEDDLLKFIDFINNHSIDIFKDDEDLGKEINLILSLNTNKLTAKVFLKEQQKVKSILDKYGDVFLNYICWCYFKYCFSIVDKYFSDLGKELSHKLILLTKDEEQQILISQHYKTLFLTKRKITLSDIFISYISNLVNLESVGNSEEEISNYLKPKYFLEVLEESEHPRDKKRYSQFERFILQMRDDLSPGLQNINSIFRDGVCFLALKAMLNKEKMQYNSLIDLLNLMLSDSEKYPTHYYTHDTKRNWSEFHNIECKINEKYNIKLNDQTNVSWLFQDDKYF